MSSNLGPMIQRLSLMLQINAAGDALANYLTDQRDHLPWETRRDLKALFDARLDKCPPAAYPEAAITFR